MLNVMGPISITRRWAGSGGESRHGEAL